MKRLSKPNVTQSHEKEDPDSCLASSFFSPLALMYVTRVRLSHWMTFHDYTTDHLRFQKMSLASDVPKYPINAIGDGLLIVSDCL